MGTLSSKRMLVAVVVGLFALTAAAKPRESRRAVAIRPDEELVLTMKRSVKVPASFEVGGLYLGEGQRVIAWSSVGPDLLLVDRAGTHEISIPRTEGAAAAGIVERQQLISVFLQSALEVLVLDGTGALLRSLKVLGFAAKDRFVAAAFSGSEWAIAVRTPAGDCRIGIVQPDGKLHWIASLTRATYAPVLPDSFAKFSVHLTWESGYLRATSLWAPFRSLLLSRNGTILRELSPGIPALRLKKGNALWVSLPTLALEHGWLQELSNLKGDDRLLFRYDRSGRVVNSRALNAALGLVTSRPSERLLAGTLRTNGVELRLYSWHWQ